MLASLLPGVRDLRAPLAAGYLWLLAVWLGFESRMPAREDLPDSVAAVIDACGGLTPLAAGIAVSFLAYLLGVVVDGVYQILFAPAATARGHSEDRRPSSALRETASIITNPFSRAGVRSLRPYIREKVADARRAASADSDDGLADVAVGIGVYRFEAPKGPDRGEYAAFRAEVDALDDSRVFEDVQLRVLSETLSELDLVAKRLIRDQPELYAEYDRLRSEGGVPPPDRSATCRPHPHQRARVVAVLSARTRATAAPCP